MLKRLTSSLDDVYSAGGPIFAAVRDIVTATNAEQIIEALREHVLSEDIDRVSIIQIGFGPSGEPVTEAIAVSDNASVALDADLPESLRQHIGKQPVVVSSVAMLDRNAHELREYAQDVIQADSLAIFPLIGRDRTAGFLVLASRTPYAYSEREIQMLQTLAAQCAVVL